MKLIELKLRNFKGIKNLELKANGKDLKIHGDNSTGKTTIFDSFLWLLFDKDSQNKSDFAIKTLDKHGEPIHKLDHEVEGTFSVDGETVVLCKVYREKYTKKRGTATEEFTGHETDHYIDGVPVKKNEYVARVAQIAPEDRFKLLTSPTYFNEQLSWQKRREILLEVCGDVSDADVIKSNDALVKLPAILGKRTLDDHRKVVVARRAEINKELDRIPVRVDEVNQGLPDISAIGNPEAIEGDLDRLAREKAEKERELADLLSGGNTGEVRKKISTLETDMMTTENDYKRQFATKVNSIEDKIKGSQNAIRGVQSEISIKKMALESGHKSVEVIEKSITDLRDKWHQVNDRELGLCVDESCPTCGQNLPTDKVQEAKDKAIADFNTSKAQNLSEISIAGKANKAELEKVTGKIAELGKEIEELESGLGLLAENNANLNGNLVKEQATEDDYKDLDNYKTLIDERCKLQKQLDGEQVDIAPEKERIEAEIKTLDETADAIRNAKAKLEFHTQGEKRIRELEAQMSILAAEFEKLEQELWLIEEFIRTKVNLLDIKINSKFKLARFRLFEEQVNGGLADVCETTFDGVPYSSGLNNAARINVGLDVINTLSEHYGFAPLIFVDNAEAVTELIPVEGQLISLIVSAKDKTLRIEGCEQAASKEQTTLFGDAM